MFFYEKEGGVKTSEGKKRVDLEKKEKKKSAKRQTEGEEKDQDSNEKRGKKNPRAREGLTACLPKGTRTSCRRRAFKKGEAGSMEEGV